jgi:hypothetical protein
MTSSKVTGGRALAMAQGLQRRAAHLSRARAALLKMKASALVTASAAVVPEEDLYEVFARPFDATYVEAAKL